MSLESVGAGANDELVERIARLLLQDIESSLSVPSSYDCGERMANVNMAVQNYSMFRDCTYLYSIPETGSAADGLG